MTDMPAAEPLEALPLTPSRERAFRDVFVQVMTRVLNLALGIVVTALVVRTLGDSGYGQWMTILTTFQLVGFFTSLGLEQVAVREAAADPRHAEDWVGALVVTRLALTLPVMVVGLGALTLISQGHTMFIAGIILLVEFPFGVGSSLAVVHQLRVHNTLPMIVLTLNSVLWGACVLVIYLSGGGLVALALSMTLVTTATAMMQAFAAFKLLRFRLRPSRAAIIRLLRVGAPLGVAGLLVNAYARVDQIIVFEKAGSQAAGYYGAVYRVLEQAHFIPISVLTTLAPIITTLYVTDRARMLRIVTLAAEFLAIGALGALAFASVAAEPLMRLFFGEEFVPAAPALPILGGAFVFICYGYLTGNLLLVLGLAHRQIIVGIAGLVVNVIGNLILVPKYGFLAAAWMTLATEVVVVGTGGYFVVKELGGLRMVSVGRLPRVVAAAAVLLVVLLALDAMGGGLVVLALASALLYPALLLGLRAVAPQELKVLLLKRPEQPAEAV
ncbi:flippase [Baekduia sp.]|jgi:O-antigen/teichoic acid export membrane protein|uniref:flippase n=1 Tax=Baekduia sp. TaxID=2600305 RepID=UPI002E0A2687|nr:flippase [Baekduia sp.]